MPLPTLEQLKERAAPWLSPISPTAPTGQSSKMDPAYESVVAEIAKLEALTGGEVDWSLVIDRAGTLLTSKTKDLLLACYLAAGLQATKKLEGLVTGLMVLSELMAQYWPTMFPEVARLRGRANGLEWFVKRTVQTLNGGRPNAGDRDGVETAQMAAAHFAQVAREKLAANTPAMGPLTQALDRWKQDLPLQTPPNPTQSQAQAQAQTQTPFGLSGVEASLIERPSLPPPTPVPPTNTAEAIPDFLRQVGTSLLSAAITLRQANTADPAAYRVVRTGLWLHVTQEPPVTPSTGRTGVPPLPSNFRDRLEKLVTNTKWAEALDESEGALSQFRFCLDLQRWSAQALAGLGPTHAAARKALVSEVQTLLRRLPALSGLRASDGTLLADATTQTWLAEEILATRTSAPETPSTSILNPAPSEWLSKARELLKSGQAPAAIALLQGGIQSATTARERFSTRLGLARICAEAGQQAVARGLFASLDEECVTRGLDDWDPKLAIETLEGLLSCTRSLAKAGQPFAAELTSQYHRLCRLAPDVALRFGG